MQKSIDHYGVLHSMKQRAIGRLRRLHLAYVWGLLALSRFSLFETAAQGMLPCSVSYAARQWAAIPLQTGCPAPSRARLTGHDGAVYLVVDFTPVRHGGLTIQGLDQVWSTAEKRCVTAHQYTSSAYVHPYKAHDPIPADLRPRISAGLATESVPFHSTLEVMQSQYHAVHEGGVGIKAVVVDAEFTTKLNLAQLLEQRIPVLGRVQKRLKVLWEEQSLRLDQLASRWPRARCSPYPALGWRAKRLEVNLPEVGTVQVLIVWHQQGADWKVFFLISTVQNATVGELLRVWKRRWQVEVLHRLYKQNFNLTACPVRHYAHHARHAHLVLEGYFLAREQREHDPSLTWRQAIRGAALELRSCVVIDAHPLAA